MWVYICPKMTQKRALEILLNGDNVFLTGPPGAGKTYLLNVFIEAAAKAHRRVAVTATTGIAATHIFGQTINSWAGLGYANKLKTSDREAIKARIKLVDTLVIDEISMMDPKTLNILDVICKINRKSSKPFGGIQVVLVGDFFQLPPVTKKDKELKYVFKSPVWSDLELKVCYLSDQHRQDNDNDLSTVLKSIRQSTFGEVEQNIVSKRLYLSPHNNSVVKLLSHNYDVEQVNKNELEKLKGKVHIYMSFKRGNEVALDLLKSQILASDILFLKEGSEVMFVVNNPDAGYFNGSRGTVKELGRENIIIKIYGNGYVRLKRFKFRLDTDIFKDTYISQFPIKLSWGLTIHKSQGMTLDKAEIDLSHAFLPNMGYVALSRLRSIEGLYLKDYNKMAFMVNSEISKIDHTFRKLSAKLSD